MQSSQNEINKLKTFSSGPNNVWCVTAPKYPPFFIMRWFFYLKNYLNTAYEFTEDINTLGCSFLGEGKYYWLGNLDDYPLKKKQEILNYILAYNGPHTVGLYIDNDSYQKIIKKQQINLVDLSLVDLVNFGLYMPWLKTESKNNFKKTNFIDQAVLLHEYSYLVNENLNSLLAEWPIFEIDESLFNLAKYFFKKDYKNFFILMGKFQETYAVQFYLSYFADQLFRAIFYCYYRQHNLLEEAKTISYKLPFNLMQNDWQFLDIDYLKIKLVKLYEIDYQIKNGGSPYLLDSWLLEYFHDQ